MVKLINLELLVKEKHKINNQIRHPKVMLVGDNVERNTYPIETARKLAEDLDLDLVMVNANNDIPVCKIMDYNKFIFKKDKVVKPQKTPKLKTVRLRPNTDEHDLEIKFNQILKFLKKGHKVKVYVFFKGRENIFRDKGQELLLRISVEIAEAEAGLTEALPKMEGRNMSMFIKPNKKK